MDDEGRYQQAENSEYDCLLMDLDDTLYPLSSGIAAECRKNIEGYMGEKLGIDVSKVPEISLLLYQNYGTTMAGLRGIGYDFDYDEYHSIVHGRLPYEENLKPDPVLKSLLMSLSIRKVIFTNADKIHAAKVLSRLGLEDCFEGIICFETLNPTHSNTACDGEDNSNDDAKPASPRTKLFDIFSHCSQPNIDLVLLPKTPILCKPNEIAFERALELMNIKPQRTIFFDDSIRNIQAAKRAGLHTVLVGTSQRVEGADYALESIHNIREALPELWEGNEKTEKVKYSEKAAIETSVVVA